MIEVHRLVPQNGERKTAQNIQNFHFESCGRTMLQLKNYKNHLRVENRLHCEIFLSEV